jgi:multimeric flavodoxin WrbA
MNHLVIDASTRYGHTFNLAQKYFNLLDESESKKIIRVKDLTIKECIGCNVCLRSKENHCPFYSDDCNSVASLLQEADTITFFIPNFALNVPGKLKMLFDRLSYIFHRPRLFGKYATCFVVEGVYGGKKIIKYHDELMGFWGANITKGSVFKGGLVYNDIFLDETKDNIMIDRINSMKRNVEKSKFPNPSLFRLMIFRMTRSSMINFKEATEIDKQYYYDNGWNVSDYYYDVKLNIFQKLFGHFFDGMIRRMAR